MGGSTTGSQGRVNPAVGIASNYRALIGELPPGVTLVAAVKSRTAAEVMELVEAGGRDIGHNYLQEALSMRKALGEYSGSIRWHMIGGLQRNKIGKAVEIFDLIQSVDSPSKAIAIDSRAREIGKSNYPILLQINISEEDTKYGFSPKADFAKLLHEISAQCKSLRISGLMTMGAKTSDRAQMARYFGRCRELFEELHKMPGANMRHLSMGMTDSYRVAIEKGANMLRIGSAIFGPRPRAEALGKKGGG